jgi:hypothetical protein
MTTQQETRNSAGEAIDNLCYDLITVIAEKSKGLEAYDKYEQDSQGNSQAQQIFQQLRQQDQQAVQSLLACLHDHLHSAHSDS